MSDFDKPKIPSSKDAQESIVKQVGMDGNTDARSALMWTNNPGKLDLSIEELEKMRTLIENPPAPSERLLASVWRSRN